MNMVCRRFLSRLAVRSEYAVLHACVVSLVVTATFMVVTSGAWGAMAPLIIALSCYVVLASVLAEVCLGLFSVVRKLAQAGIRG